jgi:hypothetical protein
MIGTILHSLKHLGSQLKQSIKQWTKPATVMLVTGTFTDMTRRRLAGIYGDNAWLSLELHSPADVKNCALMAIDWPTRI